VVLNRTATLLSAVARKQKVEIRFAPFPELPPVPVSEVALEQVFVNLMLNAIQLAGAYRQGNDGCGSKRAWRMARRLPVEVRVIDNGPGIHRRWWSRILDLGFTTRPGGSAWVCLWLTAWSSLSAARCYVEESLILTGTTFVVALPAVQEKEGSR